MTFLRALISTGLQFAKSTSERRSILLSSLVSLILFGLGIILVIAYYFWYGWSVVALGISITTILCLVPLFANYFNLSLIGRVWISIFIPIMVISLSIYSKRMYYDTQEELDYFSFRFIILACCILPAIFFSFERRAYLIITSLISLLVLLSHDPLHAYFGVPYRHDNLKLSNYSFSNVIVLITYLIIMGGVFFLKWLSERGEKKSETLIQKLNKMNEELIDKNTEIEAQNQEIIAQSDNLNYSQKQLQDAYLIIEEQKNLLFKQNETLSTELSEANKDLTSTNTELIKHNNELRQFSYTVSHNLRGPVASLIGLIHLIDQPTLNEETSEIYKHIRTSVKRLDNIITDLSKIIDIRHDIFSIRQKISLAEEVNEIIQGFKKDVESHHVLIHTDLKGCEHLYSVRPMVHSILYNLVSNAIKYRALGRRPEITITARVGQHYIIEVTDNGMGIDLKNHQENLFKLYKRFHYHTEGKGLGLYLVKLQAEALGGYVEVKSEINRATTFTIYLNKPENVEQQVLHEDPHAKIFYDAKINAIGIIWNGPLSSPHYRKAFMKCLEFVKAYNTPNYITDLTNQGHISKEDQLWMFHEILPEVAQYGLKRIAAIKPDTNDPLIAEYLKGISENVLRLGIQQKYFSNSQEGIDWIHNESEKALTKYYA
jgi:signal transduction histidine kinase